MYDKWEMSAISTLILFGYLYSKTWFDLIDLKCPYFTSRFYCLQYKKEYFISFGNLEYIWYIMGK